MKKYTNPSVGMKTIQFADGSGAFLKRGMSIETAKEVNKMDVGILVEDVPKPSTKKTPTKTNTSE